MLDGSQRAKSSEAQQRRKRKPAGSGIPKASVSRQLKEVYAHLPDKQQRFIRTIAKERIELEKELKKLRLEWNDFQIAYRQSKVSGIDDRKEMNPKRDLASEVLKVLNRGSGTMTLLIHEVLRLIAEATGFEAVGLRLRQGDDFPYYEQNGFSDDFLCGENYLCSRGEDDNVILDSEGQPVLECTCGLVLKGKVDSSQLLFTEGGSFWINRSSDLLVLPKDADPRTNPRNNCIHSGFLSVALIPVHSGHEIIGLLQLNDRREGRLSPELVRFLEGLGDQIGLAIQRKQAEDALRQSQLDLNRAQAVGQIGSWRLDVESNILTWSDEHYRIFGISKETPLNYQTFFSTVYEEDRQYVDDTWNAALRGEPYDIEHRIGVNGEVKWVRVKAYLEFDSEGKLRGGFGITQDITRSKQAEEELRMLNESLERRVEERSVVAEHRAEQLQKLTMELTIAEQRERQRLAMVLHDGLQQVLVGSKIQLGFIEQSQNIHQAVEQAKELIDDAIEISRSLTAELSPPILLQGDFILACEWLAGWMSRKYGLQVHFVTGEKIRPLAEEMKLLLFQALRELLFNVVKHAGVNEAVVRLNEKDGWIETVVEDEGRGFDPAVLRIGSGQSEGMGLFGIRERLTYFGGRMEIDSSRGKGSRFTMILPNSILATSTSQSDKLQFIEMPDVDSRADSRPADKNRKIRVLLADDHIVMRQSLSRLLQKELDMEIVGEAVDGESAIESARELLPDVVLLDINMPGISGIEAARTLHNELPGIRIIGVSMYEEDEQASEMKKAGASGYISKNGSPEAVLDVIRACMDKKTDNRE